jgi:hypothetical protein
MMITEKAKVSALSAYQPSIPPFQYSITAIPSFHRSIIPPFQRRQTW